MQQDLDNRRTLTALGIVLLLHIAVWYGLAQRKEEGPRPKLLPVVNVVLEALTPREPQQIRAPEPKPLPKPERKPVPQPQSRPVPEPVPTAEPAIDPVKETPAPAVTPLPVAAAPAPPDPAPVVVQPAPPVPEPAIEPPRYNAAYLSNPPPPYPLAARRRGIEGTVLVRAEISAGGECLRVELKKTSGADILDQAALQAVKGWRFVPAKRGSQALVAWVEVPITFKLEN